MTSFDDRESSSVSLPPWLWLIKQRHGYMGRRSEQEGLVDGYSGAGSLGWLSLLWIPGRDVSSPIHFDEYSRGS